MNPLQQLAGMAQAQQPQRPAPAPTENQTIAAVHHFGQIKSAFGPMLKDPKLGKDNIRPKLLDTMSKLLANKVLTLPEIMNAAKALPEDPIQQKKFVEKIYNDNSKAQMMVLQQHAQAKFPEPEPGAPEPTPYSPDTHADEMSALLKQYK